MTSPYAEPAAPPQVWAWQPRSSVADPVRWLTEGVVAVVGTIFVALAGAIAGVCWHALAPKLSIRKLVESSDTVFRAQVGADVWFLGVTAVAAVLVTVALCVVVRRPGPGAAVAVGVGGFLAALVADRVGYIGERHSTTTALHALGLNTGNPQLQDLVDFKVRALGVLAVWPLVGLAVLGLALAVDARARRSDPST